MVSPDKVHELRAVVNFWKYQADALRRHLQTLQLRQAAQAEDDRCGRNYMGTLVEMKARELSECQRSLRRAQASLGRALELTPVPAFTVEPPTLESPLPLPVGEMNGVERRSRA